MVWATVTETLPVTDTVPLNTPEVGNCVGEIVGDRLAVPAAEVACCVGETVDDASALEGVRDTEGEVEAVGDKLCPPTPLGGTKIAHKNRMSRIQWCGINELNRGASNLGKGI